MKTNPAFAALFCATFSLPCLAETFTLKDGSTLEGKIISEAGDNYVLDVQVTKSIRDEKTIPKSDVVKVSRELPDLKAFEALGKIVTIPTPDLLSVDDYVTRINAVQKFLKAYPTGTKTAEATAMLSTLKSEVTQVEDGGVKLNGKIIPSSEYKANAYDLDARVQDAKIRSLVEENQFIPALRLFSDFDRDYRTSLSYGELAPLMKQVIQRQMEEAKQALSTLPARLKQREVGLQQMAPEDRTSTAQAIKEESDAIEARYKAEKEAKQKWVTTSPFHKASLDDIAKLCQSELVRLSTVKTVLGVDGGKAYRELYSVVNSGANASAVSVAVTAAKTALVPVRYTAPLEAAAKGRK